MRLAKKGSQVQCDHRRPLSEQSCAKALATLYKYTPLRHLPGDCLFSLGTTPPLMLILWPRTAVSNVLCKPPHLGLKNLPWPSPLWSWSPSTMAHRFLEQCSGVPNKYHSRSETLSVTWIDRIITNVLLCFKVFCWNISILSWNQKKMLIP